MEHSEDVRLKDGGWKKPFLTIAVGQTVSLVGSSAVQFSLIWWLASETGSPLMMSLAGLLAFLPQLILGPFAGVWVDRLKRKTVIIYADLFIGLVAGLFAVSFFLWTPPYWLACLVLGVRAVGMVFHTPAIQAAIPMLVPKEELLRANGWNQFMQSGAIMLGPVLGAVMYMTFPLPFILLFDLVGALIACICVLVVNIPEIEREKHVIPNFSAEIREGVSVFLRDKKLSIVTLSMTVSMICFMPLVTFYPLMTSDYFSGTAFHASLTEISYASGMMAGAIALSSLGKIKNKLNIVHLGVFALGGATFLCGILPNSMTGFWVFVGLCLLMGISENFINIPYIAYMQETIPKEAQGRAFSLMGSLMSLTMPLGLLVAGPVAEHSGVPLWFLIAGIVMIVVTGLSMAITFRYNLRREA